MRKSPILSEKASIPNFTIVGTCTYTGAITEIPHYEITNKGVWVHGMREMNISRVDTQMVWKNQWSKQSFSVPADCASWFIPGAGFFFNEELWDMAVNQ